MSEGLSQKSELVTPGSLAPLPFTYKRTDNPELARYKVARNNPVYIGKKPPSYTDEQLLQEVAGRREGEDWFTKEAWRKKGLPKEQIELIVGDKPITIYNYNEKPLTDEHLDRTRRVFEELGSRFPQILQRVRWILINDVQDPSGFGDEDLFPLNGEPNQEERQCLLQPRGLNLTPHRIAATSNYEGTLAHELTHLIQGDFIDEWKEKFKWVKCEEYPDEWETRPLPQPDAFHHTKGWYNKKTGERAASFEFPLHPDQFVTYYAKINEIEDIAESSAAYIFDPELLKTVAPEKYEIFSRHDARKPKPEVTAFRIPKNEISLPKVEPENILYYITEPEPTQKD